MEIIKSGFKMKIYGGNSKRIIKKHAHFNFDGVEYSWDKAQFRIDVMSRLKPGDVFFIPYTKEWGVVEKAEFNKLYINDFRWPVGLSKRDYDADLILNNPVKGWWIGEVVIHVRKPGSDSLYFVYDIEHWNAFGKDGTFHDQEMVRKFNEQVGLPLDYDLPKKWQRWY